MGTIWQQCTLVSGSHSIAMMPNGFIKRSSALTGSNIDALLSNRTVCDVFEVRGRHLLAVKDEQQGHTVSIG